MRLAFLDGRNPATDARIANENFRKLAQVQGSSDADTLDGLDSTDFALAGHDHDGDYAALAHGHVIGDVTGLQTALDGKLGVSAKAADSELLDGLNSTAFALASHTHPQSDITNLVTDLAAKAPLASPALTGNPTAPTASPGDNDTTIATTAFVAAAVAAVGAFSDIALVEFLETGVSPSTPAVLYQFPEQGGLRRHSGLAVVRGFEANTSTSFLGVYGFNADVNATSIFTILELTSASFDTAITLEGGASDLKELTVETSATLDTTTWRGLIVVLDERT